MNYRMALLCFVCVQAICFRAQSAEFVSTTPVPREGDEWYQRNALLNERLVAAGTAPAVLFIGDSITQGWEHRPRNIWTHYYGHRHAINLGIGGDRTQHVLWRLDHLTTQGLAPRLAVIMIGTNNSGSPQAEIVAGVKAVVEKTKALFPETTILLLGIFPRGNQLEDGRGRKLREVNQQLKEWADGQTIHFLDLRECFPFEAGQGYRGLRADGVHLTVEGYRLWAEAMEPTLARLLGEEPVEPMPPRAPSNGPDA